MEGKELYKPKGNVGTKHTSNKTDRNKYRLEIRRERIIQCYAKTAEARNHWPGRPLLVLLPGVFHY